MTTLPLNSISQIPPLAPMQIHSVQQPANEEEKPQPPQTSLPEQQIDQRARQALVNINYHNHRQQQIETYLSVAQAGEEINSQSVDWNESVKHFTRISRHYLFTDLTPQNNDARAAENQGSINIQV